MLCGDEFGDEGDEMNSVGWLFGLRARSCDPAFSPKLRFKFRYGGKTEKNVKFRFSLKT